MAKVTQATNVIRNWEYERAQAFRTSYYSTVLTGVDPDLVAKYVNATTLDNLRHPNRSVGSRWIRGRQSYARSTLTTVEGNRGDDGWPILGQMWTLDNASSHLPSVLGALERAAKLYIPNKQFIGRRYRVIREVATTDPRVMDDLVGIAVDKSNGQTVNAYVFDAETLAVDVLRQQGFVLDSNFQTEQHSQAPSFDGDSPIFLDKYVRTA